MYNGSYSCQIQGSTLDREQTCVLIQHLKDYIQYNIARDLSFRHKPVRGGSWGRQDIMTSYFSLCPAETWCHRYIHPIETDNTHGASIKNANKAVSNLIREVWKSACDHLRAAWNVLTWCRSDGLYAFVCGCCSVCDLPPAHLYVPWWIRHWYLMPQRCAASNNAIRQHPCVSVSCLITGTSSTQMSPKLGLISFCGGL